MLTDATRLKTIAFIYNNILALPENGRVIGVLLGNCVFGLDGQVTAKYFKHTLYTLDGLILAKEDINIKPVVIDTIKLLNDGWQLITKIKDHSCPIIEPREKWTPVQISEHFEVQ